HPRGFCADDSPPGRGTGPARSRRREPVVEEGGEEPAEAAPQRSSLRRGVDALSQAVRTAMHHHEGRIPDVGEVMDYLPRETVALMDSLELSEEQPATRAMEMLDE